MEKLTTCIYKFLWQLLHYLFSLYEFCLWLRLRIIAFCLWSYDRFQTQLEREQNEYDFLQKCKKNLSKIPKHLNLIIGPDNTQMNDKLLTRIFTYAIHMNINCISYYDTRYTNPTNSIKSRLITLEKLNCPKGWKRKDLDTHHSIWYISNDNVTNGVKPSGNGVINGTTNASKSTITNGHLTNSLSNASLEIYEIQPQNNRSLLAQICRDLFKQRNTTEIQKLLEQRTSLTERLTQEFARHLENLTEPELSIIFDNNYCTFGMLPWHTRFTEFHLHVNGQRFDVKTFAHILYKYSRCEQRWGK